MLFQARETALSSVRARAMPPGSPEFERELLRRQIDRLFPNIDSQEQFLLLSVKHSRRMVLLAFNASKNILDLEDFLREAEEGFLRHRQEIFDRKIAEKLSPVQREILESEFLRIDLDGEAARPWF